MEEGFDVEDAYPGAHYQPAPSGPSLIGLWPRVHREDQGIDEAAPAEVSGSALLSLRTAATLAAFNAALAVQWPANVATARKGWSYYASQFGALMYAVVQGLP